MLARRAKLSASLVADLTASIPRDVVISAQQQWLPNLGTEMANRQDRDSEAASTSQTEPACSGQSATTDQERARCSRSQGLQRPSLKQRPENADAANAKPDAGKKAVAADERPQNRAADQTDDLLHPTEEELRGMARPEKSGQRANRYAGPNGGRESFPSAATTRLARNQCAGNKDAKKVAPADDVQPQTKAADQTDDLLNPTEEELRGIAAPIKGAEKAAPPEAAARKTDAANAKPDSAASADAASKADANAPAEAPADSETAVAKPQARAAPVISIESDVDPESWAEYGGWYRQDYAIFYRPTGHKDKFIYSWLFLTGPQAPKGDKAPAAAVFDLLTSKDAQGSCTKCHSVDDIQGKGRARQFLSAFGREQTGTLHEFHP